MQIFLDFETRSTVELKRTGVYPYARHPDTDVWCLCWAEGVSGEVHVWVPGDNPPAFLMGDLSDLQLWAHNASFERVIYQHLMVPRYGWPLLGNDVFYCTAVEAARMALPRSLDGSSKALKTVSTKDEEGHRLMLRMCRPRKFNESGEPVWWDVPERVQRLIEYCRQDVKTEQALFQKLVRLSPVERETYLMTERMNDRGVHVDLPLLTAMRASAFAEAERQNRLLYSVTGGKVSKVTQVADLKTWLKENGIESESLNKKAVSELLSPGMDLSDEVRSALTVRQDAAKSSVAKVESMLDYARDGVMRGLFSYHAASTGRWAARGPQVQNYPRGSLDKQGVQDNIDRLLRGEAVSLDTLSSLLRSTITARPGYKLLTADYSQIEARVLAWLAQQDDLVEAFRKKENVYLQMVEAIYNYPYTKSEDLEKYTVGKSAVLGCGFGMGAKKFYTQFLGGTEEGFVLGGPLVDLAKRAVEAYRSRYDKIVRFWSEINAAAKEALANPGTTVGVGSSPLWFTAQGGFLLLRLPSGRLLFYPYPSVVEHPAPWDETQTITSVAFYGENRLTHRWEQQRTYGGWLTENAVQAIARDVLRDAMLRMELTAPLVMTVHDEIVLEVPQGRWADEDVVAKYSRIMCEEPEWAPGLPLDVEAHASERWGK